MLYAGQIYDRRMFWGFIGRGGMGFVDKGGKIYRGSSRGRQMVFLGGGVGLVLRVVLFDLVVGSELGRGYMALGLGRVGLVWFSRVLWVRLGVVGSVQECNFGYVWESWSQGVFQGGLSRFVVGSYVDRCGRGGGFVCFGRGIWKQLGFGLGQLCLFWLRSRFCWGSGFGGQGGDVGFIVVVFCWKGGKSVFEVWYQGVLGRDFGDGLGLSRFFQQRDLQFCEGLFLRFEFEDYAVQGLGLDFGFG